MPSNEDPSKDLEVSVRLSPSSDAFEVTLQIGGVAEAPCKFDFALDPSSRVMQVVRSMEQRRCSIDQPRDVGAELWHALLTEPLAKKFRDAAAQAEHIVLQLQIPEDDRLQRLPWETLFDPKFGAFFSCHPKFTVVHLFDSELQRKFDPQQKLTVLVVVPQGADLDVDKEIANIRLAVAKLGEDVKIEECTGIVEPNTLSKRLRQEPWSVVHFIGHGQLRDNRVEVRLNDDTGGEKWVSAAQFGSLFAAARINVCVLNCCEGGTATNVHTLDRLAPNLLKQGVRAVVAMRYSVVDKDAILFSRTFYDALLNGDRRGRIGYATQRGRWALYNIANQADGGRIFIAPLVHTIERDPQFFESRSRPKELASEAKARTAPAAEPIPAGLRESIARRRCVIVVGLELDYPATREGQPSTGLRRLLGALEQRLREKMAEIPVRFDQVASPREASAEILLARLAEKFHAAKQQLLLLEVVQQFYSEVQPTQLHRALIKWAAPGLFYTHFDGLMESAITREGGSVRVASSPSERVEASESVLVLVRGTINDHRSLVLTEHQHFELTQRIQDMDRTLASLSDPKRMGEFRTVLFLGSSPSDRVVRHLGRKLLTSPEVTKTFFVSDHQATDDECFWNRFDTHFIRTDPASFIRAIDDGASR